MPFGVQAPEVPVNVLVSLHPGYGLGDSVMMSAVLQHIKKHRPDWVVDYQAEEGRHQVGRGIVARTFARGTPYPKPHYDAEVTLTLYDRWYGWTDRPNTVVSSCLHECLGMAWDSECGRYVINVSEPVRQLAAQMPYQLVAIHSEGRTAKAKKDLTKEQTEHICSHVWRLGCHPYLIGDHNVEWGGNAEMTAAIIARCRAFVGIDSGPAKCASATDTPSLVVWTGHHPAAFHDPAPNTTHLIPRDRTRFNRVIDSDVMAWFAANYDYHYYDGDPVPAVREWLEGVLR